MVLTESEHFTYRAEPGSVELWTTDLVPFGKLSTWQTQMLQTIKPHLRALRCAENERLHGTAVFDATGPQPDAENITFYNFQSCFAGLGCEIGFERAYQAWNPTPRPLNGGARYYHRWAVVPSSSPFLHWAEGEVVARVANVPLDAVGDLALNTWRAMRENPALVSVISALSRQDYFGVDLTLSHPTFRKVSIGTVKALIDGVLAGMQRGDTIVGANFDRLLKRRWGRPMDAQTLQQLITSPEPRWLFQRAPFNGNGLAPCDELCIAATVRVTTGPPTVSGRVFRVTSR